MEELGRWEQEKEDDLKDFEYSEPPVLSPVAAMNCDKVSVPSNSVKHLDVPPPVELAILPHAKCADVPSPLIAETDEGKKSTPKTKQNHLKYQFQLRPCHAVKGKQKLFRCDICDGIYRHAFSLKRHFLRTHINYKYLSEADKSNCNITATAINSNHRSTNLKGLDSSRWPPDESLDTSFDDQDDTKQRDFPFLFSCYSCQEYFHQQDELKSHVDNHTPVVKQKEFRCEKCKLTFTLKKNLRRHMAIHDSGRKFTCTYCNKQFFTLASHKMHERIHEGKKSHKCSQCTASFIHYNNLKEHTQYQHGANYHPCNVCSKFFDSEELLTLHAEEHMELSVVVKLNGKATTLNYENDSSDYSREATQLFESPSSFDYTCTVCGKKFLSYVNMCRHHRLAHQSSPKKRGRPQKSKVPRPEIDCRIVHSTITENTEAEFYNNVANKISDNLVNFVDGKYLDLEQYCSSSSTFQFEIDSHLNVPWHCYNFPPNFDYSKVELSESESEIDSNIERNSEDLLSDSFYSGNESDMANVSNDVFEINDDDDDDEEEDDQNCEFEIDDNVTCCDKSIGQNIPLTYICCACVERFSSLVAIEEHKINNHPNVFCTHIEIEGEKNIPPEFCQQFCSPIGIFKRYIVPSLSFQSDGLACTKCQKIFKSVSDLHLHILECGGGSNFKSENTNRRKGLRKKKLRQGMKVQNNSQRKNDVNNTHTKSTSNESINELYNSLLPVNEMDRTCSPKVTETSEIQSKTCIKDSEVSTSLEQETLQIQAEGNMLLEKADKIQILGSDVSNVETEEIEEHQIGQGTHEEVKENIDEESSENNHEKELDATECSTKKVFNKSDFQLHLTCIDKETKENQPAKPYSCKECKKSFFHLLTFDRHKKGCMHRKSLHRSIRKTVCWKSKRKIHPYSCPMCRQLFVKLSSLKKHLSNTCYKKKKRKCKNRLLNYKKVNFARLTNAKYSDEVNQPTRAENSDMVLKVEEKGNRCLQIISKNFGTGEHVKTLCLDPKEKQSSVNTQINESDKTDLTLKTNVSFPFKQIWNTEHVKDEFSATASHEIKSENSTSRELFPEQCICPHCFRTFAYLANYRRHLKKACPVKKQLDREIDGNGVKLQSPVPIFARTTFTVKGKIEDSVIGLLRDQSRQSEMMRASEPECGGPAPSPRFRTFSCKVCHKIFLSFVKMLQHRLSHKLQSVKSEDLPKLDLGLMEKLQSNSTIDSSFEQQNAQEILNTLDDYLIKASEDELERAEQNIVMLSNQSETDSHNQPRSTIEGEAKSSKEVVKIIHSCEVCNKSFSTSASKLKHHKIAHRRTIPRKIKDIKENAKRIFKHSANRPKNRSSTPLVSNVDRVKRFGKKRPTTKRRGTKLDRNLSD